MILYNGNDHVGESYGPDDVTSDDFLAVFMNNGYIEFAFNAGDGITIIRYFNIANIHKLIPKNNAVTLV